MSNFKTPPMGFEWTFISKKERSDEYKNKTISEFSRDFGLVALNDQGAIEIRTKVYTSVLAISRDFLKFSKWMRQRGYFSNLPGYASGGMHVRIDEDEVRLSIAEIIKFMDSNFFRLVSVAVNERLDQDNAVNLPKSISFRSLIGHKEKTFNEFLKSLIDKEKSNYPHAISYDPCTFVPCYEIRCFDSPYDLKHMLAMLQLIEYVVANLCDLNYVDMSGSPLPALKKALRYSDGLFKKLRPYFRRALDIPKKELNRRLAGKERKRPPTYGFIWEESK